MPLKVTVETLGADGRLFRLAGDLDHYTAPLFEREAAATMALPVRTVIVDLTSVSYLGSAGIHVLLGLLHHVARTNGRLVVACGESGARSALEMVGLHEVTPVVASLEEARQTAQRDTDRPESPPAE